MISRVQHNSVWFYGLGGGVQPVHGYLRVGVEPMGFLALVLLPEARLAQGMIVELVLGTSAGGAVVLGWGADTVNGEVAGAAVAYAQDDACNTVNAPAGAWHRAFSGAGNGGTFVCTGTGWLFLNPITQV